MLNAAQRTLALMLGLAALLAAGRATAQAPGSEQIARSGGRLFVVAFPDTTTNTFDARYANNAYVDKAVLMIYSAVDASVVIRGRGYRDTIETEAGKFSVVTVMGDSTSAPAPIVTEHCKPVDNTFTVESDAPIVLYQYLVTKFGTEAWTPLPVEAWGNEYYAAGKGGEIGSDVAPGGEFDYKRKNKMFPAEILVIAAYDGTRITIVPNGQVLDFCRAENVMLNAGEAYQIQSYVDTLTANVGGDQPDFAGSRIFSTKPVGVITGNTRAQTIDENVGLGKNIFKNMFIEWLAPIEQHGTQFVYMPTWDARRPTGAPNEDPSEKRKAEFVRVYATTYIDDEPTRGFYLQGGVPIQYDAPIEIAKFAEIRHTPNRARVHYTDKPAQAMMHAAAVVKYAGTTQGFGGYIGAAYDGWGGYMVELTPREQWVSFAPYYASTHPAGTEHFINVVVDTNHLNDVLMENGSAFIFQRRIEGTDLIWGSMAVTPGVDHWLEGRNGARFAGFVYGGLARGGHEEYRPGLVRNRDDDREGAMPAPDDESDDGSDPMPLHPSEYEERLAIAYGYPLAANRVMNAPGDSLAITSTADCFGTCVTVELINDDPVGLRSADLDNGVNAMIDRRNPYPLTGAVKASICVGPIDPTLDASATLVISDKTGKATRMPITHTAHRLATTASRIDFGVLVQGDEDTLAIVLRNRTAHEIPIANVEMLGSNPEFRILGPGAFPLTVAGQDSVVVRVAARASRPKASYNDTLIVSFSCSEYRLPVLAATNEPCLRIPLVDFGAMPVGASSTRPLRILNVGGGIATFENPGGGDVLEFSRPEYSVSAADLAMLADTSLAAGRFVDVAVTFTASATGEFRDTARLWTSRNYCDSTSAWVGRVTEPVSAPVELGSITAIEAIHPNPTDGATTIRFALARPGRATIELFDERGARVATLLDAERQVGAHSVVLEAASLAPGVYHVRLEAEGVHRSRSFVRR